MQYFSSLIQSNVSNGTFIDFYLPIKIQFKVILKNLTILEGTANDLKNLIILENLIRRKWIVFEILGTLLWVHPLMQYCSLLEHVQKHSVI